MHIHQRSLRPCSTSQLITYYIQLEMFISDAEEYVQPVFS